MTHGKTPFPQMHFEEGRVYHGGGKELKDGEDDWKTGVKNYE
ncbi:MAG TPA: hypothetical protein VG028_05295 [Terriglobia bacterium]|nr:hypothetical protein [Terriglobia bacterium]